MKSQCWNVDDAPRVETTGKPIAHWIKTLDKFKAGERKSNDVVADLQSENGVARDGARTLTTLYLKNKAGEAS